ncbi:hypothetical protein [Pseudohoeflea coraliihabitans]|uniref:Uncharacterized protein n=1 Tax=Pseudohoeflea coraliihabitans TaxID=2860393 RepID=A0ABS6WTI3_9HYPH|nr:hypothetical protein [Pseudohoeflea sp. DP4N28-3]MBW3099268.1 hypothetical protein [Pseudohoeflea sp. DP4N28-3]
MSNKQNTYDVLKVEEYTTDNGEVKPRFHRVGVAFDNQDGDGQTIIIPEGISVSGRIVTKARKEREADAG